MECKAKRTQEVEGWERERAAAVAGWERADSVCAPHAAVAFPINAVCRVSKNAATSAAPRWSARAQHTIKRSPPAEVMPPALKGRIEMPGGDRTGPMGRGSMTGWGRGGCRDAESWRFSGGGFAGRGRALGFGGGGGGRGWQHRFWSRGRLSWLREDRKFWPFAGSEVAETEREWLERRSAAIDAEKAEIAARLEELDSENTS